MPHKRLVNLATETIFDNLRFTCLHCSVSDIKKGDYFKNTHALDPRWRVHVMGNFKKFLTFGYLETANKLYSLIILFQEQLIDRRDM